MLELSDYADTCQVRVYDIEAISLPIVYNKYGDYDPNGLMYVLKKDSQRIQEKARKLFELPVPRPCDEVQPLVIRANVGDRVQINFENKLSRRASIHVQGLSYEVKGSDGQIWVLIRIPPRKAAFAILGMSIKRVCFYSLIWRTPGEMKKAPMCMVFSELLLWRRRGLPGMTR